MALDTSQLFLLLLLLPLLLILLLLSFLLLLLLLDLCLCKYVLVLVYHPPSSSFQANQEFINSFTRKLREIRSLKQPTIVAGDFNLNLYNPKNFSYIDVFINNMFELHMLPVITKPTRVNMIL